MPNRATMNQPSSPTRLWTGNYSYCISHNLHFGSLIVPTINKEPHLWKPEDKSTRPLLQNKYFQTSKYIQCDFFFLRFFFSVTAPTELWLVQMWRTLKRPTENRSDNLNIRDQTGVIPGLTFQNWVFKGNETEMSAWDSVTYSTAGCSPRTTVP